MTQHRLSLKEALLDAAEEVAVREGVARLTFDAVAAEAGISKGGVLHHFSNKDQLLEALVRRSAESWLQYYLDAFERTPEGPGRMARAILHNCLLGGDAWTEALRRRFSSVLAALIHNPALVQAMRESYAEIDARLKNDGLPEGVGETIGAAVDGVWLNWALRFCDAEQDSLKRMHGALNRILEEALREIAPAPSPENRQPGRA